MRLFQRKGEDNSANGQGKTAQRSSRGWGETLAFLKQREGLRVLDFGATSSHNINYLTSLGQSVYMANVVEDASRAEWMRVDPEHPDAKPEFDTEAFAAANFDFSGKEFDVVLLWDTADYLPPGAVPMLFAKLHNVLRPEGRLLAFFHGRKEGPETGFARFHVTEGPELTVQPLGAFPVQQLYQTRQIEKFLNGYSDVRFLLGKDNVREVIATR
jgi:SAM-dependent methyltransferase